MDNYMMLEGKKIPLTDEQVKMLKAVGTKKAPFERVKEGEDYYAIDIAGEVIPCEDYGHGVDDTLFNVANYCTDEELMQRRALHETLNRLLWRYSMEHGEQENEWDGSNNHYSIGVDVRKPGHPYTVIWCQVSTQNGLVYFPTSDIAQAAIQEIVEPFIKEHPEFVW